MEVSQNGHPLQEAARTVVKSLSCQVTFSRSDFSADDMQKLLDVYGASCENLYLRCCAADPGLDLSSVPKCKALKTFGTCFPLNPT